VSDIIAENIRDILMRVGEDPDREGLLETPDRVSRAMREKLSGYKMKPADIFKTFEAPQNSADEMVIVRDIPFYSMCEHHMESIFGTVTVGYIPDGRIAGLSKFKRLVDIYARRLQVQERLTRQICDAMATHLEPRGAGVIVTARHMCIEARGVRTPGSVTVTNALYGVFADHAVRSEFLSLAK
jgi:GTP cyclohydrolase I